MRVLVATDGSGHADVAVAWLGHLPFPADRKVMVVTVVEPDTHGVVAGSAALSIRQARQVADGTASRLLTGRSSVGRVVEGDARNEILAAASQWGADVVVLGSRGLGRFTGLFRASVSLAIVRKAPCPVVVCKGPPREVRTITIGLDGSEHARRALAWVARLPLAPTSRVHLVGVVESPRDLTKALRIGRAQLDTELSEAAQALEPHVAEVETTVTTGAPGAVLVQEAERRHGDLLVVGARGAGPASRMLLGSVSESVLRHARCPVLVVRAAGDASRRGAAAGRRR